MKVSVLMLAYNHGPFIGQAIESVLAQELDDEWELVIGEDVSTDNTRAVVADYAARFPQRIRPLMHETNLGMFGNFAAVLIASRGRYVSIVEGDDFWTDSQKLARSIAMFEDSDNLSIVFHQVEAFAEEGAELPAHYAESGGVFPAGLEGTRFGLNDILRVNFIQTCSATLLRSAIGVPPEWLGGARLIDWPIFILAARHGDIGFIPRVMARYRVHETGLWSTRNEQARRRDTIWVLEHLLEMLDRPSRRIVRNTIANLHVDSILYPPADPGDRGRLAHLRAILANLSPGELFGRHSVLWRLPRVIAHRIKSL